MSRVRDRRRIAQSFVANQCRRDGAAQRLEPFAGEGTDADPKGPRRSGMDPRRSRQIALVRDDETLRMCGVLEQLLVFACQRLACIEHEQHEIRDAARLSGARHAFRLDHVARVAPTGSIDEGGTGLVGMSTRTDFIPLRGYRPATNHVAGRAEPPRSLAALRITRWWFAKSSQR